MASILKACRPAQLRLAVCCLVASLCSLPAAGSDAVILGADSPVTLTALHSKMLEKYGTWVGLRTLCQTEAPAQDSDFLKVGFHLIYAPEVLKPIDFGVVRLADPVVFSISQSRSILVSETALEVAQKAAADPNVCKGYEAIEKEALRYFSVKGVLQTAQQSYKNFKKQ